MPNPMIDFIGSSGSGGFPVIFKGPSGGNGDGTSGGQKVICTPEVSLYTYNGNGPNRVPSPISPSSMDDDKGDGGGGGGGILDLDGTDTLVGHHHLHNHSTGSSNGGFQCGVCGKVFQQKNTFQNHLRSHREGEDPYQCDICGKTFAVPARLTRHYRTHTGEKPYQCEYCNKSFSVKENLSVHRRIHTKERPYKCEVCERAFEHSGKLHRHMRIHTGERPHRCQICQKTFIQSGQLVIHMRTHTGEKPYVCKVCSKGFTCSKQLKVHSRTHTGEKPYSCDICGKSFGYNHVLKLHQVAHYGEKVYKCTLCNSTFNSKKALENHIKTHSSAESPSPGMSPPPSVEMTKSGTEPRQILSPKSNNSQGAPQHSDKENRECSDSDVSSQNSPTAQGSPRSPPRSPRHYVAGNNGIPGHSVNNGSPSYLNQESPNRNLEILGLPSIPYPMLPPSVQIHQSPQSRTTFLYVTSKLPQVGSSSTNPNTNFGGTTSSSVEPLSLGRSPPRSMKPTDLARDRFLRQSASIRDKVLASIEMFGYGLSSGESSTSSSSSSSSSSTSTTSSGISGNDLSGIRSKGIKITPVGNNSGGSSLGSLNFGRGKYQDSTVNRNTMSGALVREGNPNNNLSITPIPDCVSVYSCPSRQQRSRDELPTFNPYSPTHPPPPPLNFSTYKSTRDRSKSPDLSTKYSFGSGGVLALALTRGSKAAVNQLPLVSMSPIRSQKSGIVAMNHQTGIQSSSLTHPKSPDHCLDYSRRSGSVSPRNSNGHTQTPPMTPRSTPGLNESMDDYTEDYHPHHNFSVVSPKDESIEGLGKRTLSNGSNYGPRKRSSLIIEKYTQESHVPSPIGKNGTPPPTSTESILSQRLRQSSVIQYAERCT